MDNLEKRVDTLEDDIDQLHRRIEELEDALRCLKKQGSM